MLMPDEVLDLVNSSAARLKHNEQLIDIYEGNLLCHIDKDMKEQFSEDMYNQAMRRVVPINVLPKIIDKLTNIYQTAVVRQVIDGSDTDKELLSWYEQNSKPNVYMGSGNSLFNLCKTSLIQPYVHNYKPCLRVILNDQFIVHSDDEINPTIPTEIIILAGTRNDREIYHQYTDTEFRIINSRGEIETALMAEYQNAAGINPVGKLNFIYINESHYRLCPKIDSDILKLTKLIPVMLTDLNVAAMYQSFSILYGIDLDDENLKMAPSAFWRFKSDPTSDKRPEVGMLKPQVDYEQVLGLIEAELSMWLGTKGIRASSVGTLTTDNFASGISKVIDEMDTYEARQTQVSYFQDAEERLWDLVLHHMHPHWVSTGQIDNKTLFSPTAGVTTTFATQLPMQSRGQVVRDLKDEYAAGFISRKRAMQRLNPEFTEEDIDELIAEIDIERQGPEDPEDSNEQQQGSEEKAGEGPQEEEELEVYGG